MERMIVGKTTLPYAVEMECMIADTPATSQVRTGTTENWDKKDRGWEITMQLCNLLKWSPADLLGTQCKHP
jgi:hypothetical protein